MHGRARVRIVRILTRLRRWMIPPPLIMLSSGYANLYADRKNERVK
jgi:hypothetical protein